LRLATVGDVRAQFKEQGAFALSRKGQSDNITGFVFVKDLVTLSNDDNLPIAGLRPAVRPGKQARPELEAVSAPSDSVRDRGRRYGGTGGLGRSRSVEEIVGEIRDEYDVESSPGRGQRPLLVSGRANIDELAQRLAVETSAAVRNRGWGTSSHIGRVPRSAKTSRSMA
jgi:CBS domain containing-hemolysin-like protein